MPDEERHRFHNEPTRALAGHLLGRRSYETDGLLGDGRQGPADIVREFALVWQALPKLVFSRRLDSVEEANTTLARVTARQPVTGKEIIMAHISTTTVAVDTQ
jgi:hypothetical protein